MSFDPSKIVRHVIRVATTNPEVDTVETCAYRKDDKDPALVGHLWLTDDGDIAYVSVRKYGDAVAWRNRGTTERVV